MSSARSRVSGSRCGSDNPLQFDDGNLYNAREANCLGCSAGEVNGAATGIGAAVIDAHHDRTAGALVHDPDPCAERKGPVRRRQGIGVEAFTARSASPVEAWTVLGGPAREGLSRGFRLGGSGTERARISLGWH